MEKQSSKTIMRTPSPGKNEGKHPVSYMVNRNVFGNQVLKLLNKKKYVLVQQIHLGNANDRNKSTRMYKLWYKVYYSSACSVKKPPPPTKSKERQNHHEETWFRKIVYYAVKYEESMIVTYCSRKPALCQAQYMHLTWMCLHSQQAK